MSVSPSPEHVSTKDVNIMDKQQPSVDGAVASPAIAIIDPAEERKLLAKLDSVFVPIIMVVCENTLPAYN